MPWGWNGWLDGRRGGVPLLDGDLCDSRQRAEVAPLPQPRHRKPDPVRTTELSRPTPQPRLAPDKQSQPPPATTLIAPGRGDGAARASGAPTGTRWRSPDTAWPIKPSALHIDRIGARIIQRRAHGHSAMSFFFSPAANANGRQAEDPGHVSYKEYYDLQAQASKLQQQARSGGGPIDAAARIERDRARC